MNSMTPVPEDEDPGGRIHFSGAGRSLIEEDRIELTSVGVDIGSSTSHLLFSTIVLERLDTRYIVSERRVLHASEILLTPYTGGEEIDADALGAFIAAQYRAAGLAPGDIDTGALILTGVAARRSNARAIGELFAAEAGKFVAVSAGDSLECLMAAHGSGAAALSADGNGPVVNIDVGGGTTKIALCIDGEVVARTALDVGARLLAFDGAGRITRLEPFGRRHLADAGIGADIGSDKSPTEVRRVSDVMAGRIFEALTGGAPEGLMRLPPISGIPENPRVIFSGGVAEYMNGAGESDDLGPALAAALKARVEAWGRVIPARQRIRATVVGASQYTVQVSGSTIFLDPPGVLPLRNLAVVVPEMTLGDEIDPAAVEAAIAAALARLDLATADRPVAVFVPWSGSAGYARLAALAKGLVAGMRRHIDARHPLVFVTENDIGGLLGMQCRAEEEVPVPIVSIDGIALSEFDFIDIGEVLRATGATPVVVKSLLFPTE